MERPYKIIDGRKYVLDEEEAGPEPEIFSKISPPPRSVSLAAQLVLLLRNGHAPIFGWIFACFGMIFCILFVPLGLASLPELTHRNFTPAGKGEIISSVKTSISIDETSVYRYEFKGENGELELFGHCYTTGENFKAGDAVDLEKCDNKVRVVGSRLSSMGVFGLLIAPAVLLFPLVGIGIVLGGTFSGKKAMRLLRYGEIGKGRFIDMSPSGTQINGHNVQKLRYEFTAADGQIYEAFATALDTTKLTNDSLEPLLYDSMNPKQSILLDSLPGKICFDEMSSVFKVNPTQAILPFFFCCLFVVQIALFFYAVSIGGFVPMN